MFLGCSPYDSDSVRVPVQFLEGMMSKVVCGVIYVSGSHNIIFIGEFDLF